MNMQEISIFCLTIPRLSERQLEIEKMFSSFKINFEFVFGIDAFDLSQSEVWKAQKSSMAIGGQPLNPGEIACALGHKMIYQKIVDEKISYAIICEDDIKIGLVFKSIFDLMSNSEIEFEFMNFMTDAKYRILKPIFDIYSFCEFTEPPNRTSCYMINFETAKKLIEFQTPIKYGADTLTGKLSFEAFRSAGITPAIVALREFPTTIHEIDFGEKKYSFKTRLKKFILRLMVVIPDAIRKF